MKEIAASILGKDNKIQLVDFLVEKGIKVIHYDVMDGNFVSNHSLPIKELIQIIDNTNPHYKDVHLMVINPEEYIDAIGEKADQFSIHFEVTGITKTKEIIKNNPKSKIGIAINPETNVSDIKDILPLLNHVMIMSVVPGKGGQTFIENSLKKIEELMKYQKEYKFVIEIDGGINDKWGPIVFSKGVNIAVSGSYLINNIENDSINKIKG